MPFEILDPVAEPAADPAAAPAPKVSVLKIDGRDREVGSVTFGGKTVVYTDSLSVKERMKLSRAVPGDVSAPEAYAFDQVAARVRSINDVPVGFPASQAEIESIIDRIGDEIAEHMMEVGNADYVKRREARAKNFSATGASA
jgi:hypothetical protein